MTLDDLYEELEIQDYIPNLNDDAATPCCVTIKKDVVLPGEDEFDENDPEEDLLTTLTLLEDCLCVLEEIIDPTSDTITQRQLNDAEEKALQARAWLNQHNGEDK